MDPWRLVAYSFVMSTNEQLQRDYDRIEAALVFLASRRSERPSLDAVAAHIGLGPHHFQRLFTRWAGISPKRFLQFLTAEHARQCLAESRSVLEAAFDCGLSSPGRLHDLMVTVDAMTPGEIRSGGAGLVIRYGAVSSPFGRCFIAVTDRGVCRLGFPAEGEERRSRAELKTSFPAAALVEDCAEIARWRDRIFTGGDRPDAALPVLLAGTNFQIKVWEGLLRLPPGHLCSYGDLAAAIGRPRATRAVASAVARNNIAYLIPCHRVIRSIGELGGYRWGDARKRALIGWEQARVHESVGC